MNIQRASYADAGMGPEDSGCLPFYNFQSPFLLFSWPTCMPFPNERVDLFLYQFLKYHHY